MPRTKGSLNKKEKTEPKYKVSLKNPFDDSESSMDFPTVAEIAKFLNSKGMDICESTIANYLSGHRCPPQLLTFSKILENS